MITVPGTKGGFGSWSIDEQYFQGMGTNEAAGGWQGALPVQTWCYPYAHYHYNSMWYYLESSTETEYGPTGGQTVQTITAYNYNNPKHKNTTSVATINSNGTKHIRQTRYPQDFADELTVVDAGDPEAIALKKMTQDVHRNHNVPVEEIEVIAQDGHPLRVIKGTFNKFRETDNGLIKPYQRYVLDLEEPLEVNNVQSGLIVDLSEISSGNLIINSNYRLVQTYDLYDKYGNLLESHNEHGIRDSYKWSYDNAKPVAMFQNAGNSATDIGTDCGYASFENLNPFSSAPQIDDDRWSISYPGSTLGTIVHNGQHSVKLLPGAERTVLRDFQPTNQNGKYRLSAWIYTEGSLGNGSRLILYTHPAGDYNVVPSASASGNESYKTTLITSQGGEWQYVEEEIDLGAVRQNSGYTAPLQIRAYVSHNDASAALWVDEVIFCPKESLVRTYNYDQLFGGVQSITDETGYCTFYNYDPLGRLRDIKDQKGNLLNYYEYSYAGSQFPEAKNFIRSEAIRQSGLNEGSVASGPPGETYSYTTYQYIDGLGRTIQENARKASPLKRDIIVPHEFDGSGIETKVYEPFSKAVNNGAFVENAVAVQNSFYLSAPYVCHTSVPYSESQIEASPLRRKLVDAFPGQTWTMGVRNVKYNELTNAENEVVRWKYDQAADAMTGPIDAYQSGQLRVQETTDESGKKVRIFTDKLGRKVLERTAGIDGGSLSTCHIYNELGQLVCVMPPKAFEEFLSNYASGGINLASDPEFIKTWCFRYRYNTRGLISAKAEPGKDYTYFLYDKLSRQVFSRDPLQKENGKISFVKYDILGRTIVTGVADYSGDLESIASILDDTATPLYEIREQNNEYGYSLNQVCDIMNYIPHIINYYDDYDFNFDGTDDVTPENQNTTRTLGKLTGSKKLVFGTTANPDTYYKTEALFYDEKGRTVESVNGLQFAGQPRMQRTLYTYDFTGALLSTDLIHDPSGINLKVRYTHGYDHAGRMTSTKMKINNQPDHAISKQGYNEKGELMYKALNGMPYSYGQTVYQQTINYHYNERGWLTRINGTNNINENAEDLWGEDILYHKPPGYTIPGVDNAFSLEGTDQFSGNIGAMLWKGKRDNVRRAYGYRYDQFGRLEKAAYKANEPGVNDGNWTDVNRYTVSEMTYDANGNIENMRVHGIINRDDTDVNNPVAQYGVVDGLEYKYKGNVLQSVKDEGNGEWVQSPDFRDNGSLDEQEYQYDANLNMIHDGNKHQMNIAYNSLNLPYEMQNSLGKIFIRYSAAGEKVEEIANQNGQPSDWQEYQGDIIYRDMGNGQPEPYRILHPEGYWQWNPAGGDGNGAWEDYYFIKDHLGNVRVVFRGGPFAIHEYKLTMEPFKVEEGAFPKFKDVTLHRTDDEYYEGGFSAKVSDGVGPNINIPVTDGDSLEVSVWYYYEEEEYQPNTPQYKDLNDPFGPVHIGLAPLPRPTRVTDGTPVKIKMLPVIGLDVLGLLGNLWNDKGSSKNDGNLAAALEALLPAYRRALLSWY